MVANRLLTFALLLFVALGAPACDKTPEPSGTPGQRSNSAKGPGKAAKPRPRAPENLDYVIKYTGGAKESDELPMIIAIHGRGDRAEKFALLAGFDQPARIVQPQGITPFSRGRSWFPIAVKARDPDKIATHMTKASKAIAGLAKTLVKAFPTKGKPIVTGFSQGGMLSFALAIQHPTQFRAAFPVAGWLPGPLVPTKAPDGAPPIVAFHGEEDPLLAYADTEQLVSVLKTAGFDAKLRGYPLLMHAVNDDLRRALYAAIARTLKGEPPMPENEPEQAGTGGKKPDGAAGKTPDGAGGKKPDGG